MLKAPNFWFGNKIQHRVCTWALSPVALLYGFVTGLKFRSSKSTKVDLPVICVGNLVAGGAGKTPFVLWLAEKLKSEGLKPHIILRGYGGQEKSNRQVLPNDTVIEVGDEALLYAERFPTWVGGDRVVSARLAKENQADLVLMDDGFQNAGLEKDFSFLVIDRQVGLGNGFVLPAGPLREGAGGAFERVQCIVLMGGCSVPIPENLGVALNGYEGLVVEASIHINARDKDWLNGANVIAFSGIGRPDKFFESLRSVGANLIESHSFADHHNFTQAEFDDLVERIGAQESKAELVTTTKDFARLSSIQRQQCRAVGAHIIVKNEKDILNLVRDL